jgi:hypothetical protein
VEVEEEAADAWLLLWEPSPPGPRRERGGELKRFKWACAAQPRRQRPAPPAESQAHLLQLQRLHCRSVLFLGRYSGGALAVACACRRCTPFFPTPVVAL